MEQVKMRKSTGRISRAKIKAFFQHQDFVFWRAVMLGIMLLLMLIMFLSVMLVEPISVTVGDMLGTKSKIETLRFIGIIMGGVFAVIAATVFNHRTAVQIENNKLIEKGHINERFGSATENLGNENSTVRISAFYQFYYLAKDQPDNNFRQSIFEILCSCLRSMPRNKSHSTGEDGEEYPTAECQTLLNILFDSKYCTVFDDNGFDPDLQRANLINANLPDANLSNANLSGANLSNARLTAVNLSGAKLWRTNLSNAWLLVADLSNAYFSDANLSNACLLDANLSNAYLSDANLSKTNFSRANLSDANLSDANLSDANLSDANLSSTNLSKTNFSGANLSDANLSDANLSKTNFSRANLSDANLSDANLSDANLSDANLSDANLQRTQLKGTNLMKVRSIRNADFRGTKIDGRPITKNDLPADKGEYYADWNPPPKKEESKV